MKPLREILESAIENCEHLNHLRSGSRGSWDEEIRDIKEVLKALDKKMSANIDGKEYFVDKEELDELLNHRNPLPINDQEMEAIGFKSCTAGYEITLSEKRGGVFTFCRKGSGVFGTTISDKEYRYMHEIKSFLKAVR